MDSLRIHRVNFFTPEPTAIHSLAYDETILRLAVSRILLPTDKSSLRPDQEHLRKSIVDSAIEIWNVQHLPFLEKKIPTAFNNSVETIAWCKGRLFTVNMHGTLNEYDLNLLKAKYSIPVSSGCPLYCIGVNKQNTFIATGNEDGHIVLYRITAYSVEYETKFEKQEGRILCLDWHQAGKIIVTGSIDTIRVWNVSTGQVSNRIIVGREGQKKETFVWCLTITSDMTIISGDSRGKTCFWDGNTGTLISSIAGHKADVFALILTKDENKVYSSGIDPKILSFVKTEVLPSAVSKTGTKWMKSYHRVDHTHDVRALQLVGEYVVSGGIDCNLTFFKFPPKTVIKFSPFTQEQYCSVATEVEYILLRYPRFVEVWMLGKSSHKTGRDGEQLPLQEPPKKFVKFSVNEDEIIICSSISADGKWVAYSSLNKFRLFYIETIATSDIPILHKVVLPNITVAYNLRFTNSDAKLIVYDKINISVFKCDRVQSELIKISEDTEDFADVYLFELSPNDTFLACGYSNGKVSIYNLDQLKIFCMLPQYNLPPTALKFDASSENLVVVYSDRKVIEYNLKQQKYSKWSRYNSFTEFQSCSLHPVTNIVFKNKAIIFQDANILSIMKKTEQITPRKKKIKNTEENGSKRISEEDESRVEELKIVDRYERISSIHSTSEDLIVIEISSNDILNALPPPLYTKKFGT